MKTSYLDTLLSYIIKFFSVLILILTPIHSTLMAVLVLLLADLVTGVWAAKKEGQQITSRGIRRTIAKAIAYLGSIIIAFVVETYLLAGVPIVKVIAGLIAITEGKSFFENIHRITGVDFWSEILNKIQGPVAKTLPTNKK